MKIQKYKFYFMGTLAALLTLMVVSSLSVCRVAEFFPQNDFFAACDPQTEENSASLDEESAPSVPDTELEIVRPVESGEKEVAQNSSDDIVTLASKHSSQWPPFKFTMTPTYEDGKITYQINFSKEVDWEITDLLFKIPLPKGTRFLEAGSLPVTSTSFDGAEVTFLTPLFNGRLTETFFVVEVTDPEMTVFSTYAWMSWKGQTPGNYVTKEASIDITKKTLDWKRPRSRVELEAGATVEDNVITYAIYARNVSPVLVWDLKINVPVPDGTTLLSAEPPGEFTVVSDGNEVYFTALKIKPRTKVGPLIIKVSTNGLPDSPIVTHAWATWKNVGNQVKQGKVLAQGTNRSGDIVVQPEEMQQAVSDPYADAAFPDYDLTNITLEEGGNFFKATFYTNQKLGPVGQPLEFLLYIDSDCSTKTGRVQANRGAEYRVRYIHEIGEADFFSWNADLKKWRDRKSVDVNEPEGTNTVTVWVPYEWLDDNREFCWVGGGQNKTTEFNPKPRVDWVGQDAPELTEYGE
ncbi:MAG: hypothetical protein ACPGWR_13820 [Ardenticatenaceae bacterium]